MQVSYAAEPVGSAADGSYDGRIGIGAAASAVGRRPLRHELRMNLVVVAFSLGLSVAVAVGLSLLMTLLG